MENFYNDENLFKASKEDVQKKLKGCILVPIYWTEYQGKFEIDSLLMKDEFERTVYGIESELEIINN